MTNHLNNILERIADKKVIQMTQTVPDKEPILIQHRGGKYQ